MLSLTENLHTILRVLYDDMMVLCYPMSQVAMAIAGIGALLYIAYRVWQSLAQAEPIDLFPLMRPFAIGICILFFPTLVLGDVDGMHIRLLLITFFLQFFPDLIKKGHVYILQTPLFRVRNKKKTVYCYSEDERVNAINELSPNPEITRFKGLGEISPDEFKHFIGKDMRLEQVTLRKTDAVKELLEFYMGKNTMERQNFIIDNLVIEEDLAS